MVYAITQETPFDKELQYLDKDNRWDKHMSRAILFKTRGEAQEYVNKNIPKLKMSVDITTI